MHLVDQKPVFIKKGALCPPKKRRSKVQSEFARRGSSPLSEGKASAPSLPESSAKEAPRGASHSRNWGQKSGVFRLSGAKVSAFHFFRALIPLFASKSAFGPRCVEPPRADRASEQPQNDHGAPEESKQRPREIAVVADVSHETTRLCRKPDRAGVQGVFFVQTKCALSEECFRLSRVSFKTSFRSQVDHIQGHSLPSQVLQVRKHPICAPQCNVSYETLRSPSTRRGSMSPRS